MGEVRRRLRSWVQEHFPEAFALGNLSFLPGAPKVSVHMTKYMLHSRYTHIDEVAIDSIVSYCIRFPGLTFISPLTCLASFQVKKYNQDHPEDFYVFRPPVAPNDFELDTFAADVAKALGPEEGDIEHDGFCRVDSCVIKGQNTFLVFYQTAWMLDLIRR